MAPRTSRDKKGVGANRGAYSANVSAAAVLHGQLPSVQQSEVIYFAALTPSGLVCLGFAVAYSSLLAGALAALCFGILFTTVLVRLIRTGKEPANPSTVAVLADGTTRVSGHLVNPVHAALAMRRMILKRGPMPRPDGEIEGNVSDENAVRRYTPEEKQAVVSRIGQEIEESDLKAIDHVRSVMAAALPPPGPPGIQRQLEGPPEAERSALP